MPFLLVTIGLIMIVTGSRNTHVAFAKQVQADLTGPNNFITWIVALGAIGALGYIESLRTFSRLFMALVLMSLVLSNGGVFAQFTKALASGPVSPVQSDDNAPVTAQSSNIDPAKAAVAGAFGQKPSSPGQAKFNGWLNYLIGGGWLK